MALWCWRMYTGECWVIRFIEETQVRKLGCWHQSEDRVLYSDPLLILVLQISYEYGLLLYMKRLWVILSLFRYH